MPLNFSALSRSLPIQDFLNEVQYRTLLDVRTPAEFAQGHIPPAINLPLFSDEERSVVGTLYKMQGPQPAFLKGLDLVGPKMSWFVEEALRMAPSKKVAIHCWRGGKRSGSMAWLLWMAGFDTVTLEGGYKAYRTFLLDSFAHFSPPRLMVLGGRTGSGKTEILQALRVAGEQVIDLEYFARHKGSAFGHLGEASQPSNEQFENLLFEAIRNLDLSRRIWIENESRSIGRVFLPEGFWQAKISGTLFHLEIPFEVRAAYLTQSYGRYPKSDLREAYQKIQKRLGGQHLKSALEALDRDDLLAAASVGLVYYDKTYDHGVNSGEYRSIFRLPFDCIEVDSIANHLIAEAQRLKL